MNEAVRSALWCMAGAITEEMAQHHARRALKAGASPAVMARAWAEWHQLRDESVQTIESTGGLA